MKIYIASGIDSRRAAKELLREGMVAIDDISEGLIDVTWDEILDELSHAADELDLRRDRIATALGPVFVIRDHERVSAAKARAAVLRENGPPPAE